jgi:hypothetical protein
MFMIIIATAILTYIANVYFLSQWKEDDSNVAQTNNHLRKETFNQSTSLKTSIELFKHDHVDLENPLGGETQSIPTNTTKILGFISSHYVRIAIRWYNRLDKLGYRNHYIVCTDSESYDWIRNQSTTYYRVEASSLPPMKIQYTTLRYGKKQRYRVTMLFAHRWIYALEQLKIGYHILMTDVDNIFSSYYDMKNLELSEFDIYHALETKHPEDVFQHQGFVFCGGMGWFRSSPSAIRYVEAIVQACGEACDDQILLNRLVAYKFQVQWDRNRTEHSEVTIHTDETNVTVDRLGNHFHRLVGLPIKGFTGYSTITGARIHVWDRDFAYRGKVDPSVCPKDNWVSMPFVTVLTRGQMAHAKLSMYDQWDNHCPNDYTNITRN